VALGDGDHAEQVLPREDGTARVGRIVHHDCLRPVVDERLHLLKVGLPALLGQQVVLADRATLRLGEHLVEREARLGHEQVVALVDQPVDRDLERTRAARRDQNVRRQVRAVLRREALGDRGTRGVEAGGGTVAVILGLADESNHRFIEHLGRVQIPERGRVAQGERDHRLARDGLVLLRSDLLHDRADRVRCALRLKAHFDVPRLCTLDVTARIALITRRRTDGLGDVRLSAAAE